MSLATKGVLKLTINSSVTVSVDATLMSLTYAITDAATSTGLLRDTIVKELVEAGTVWVSTTGI